MQKGAYMYIYLSNVEKSVFEYYLGRHDPSDWLW